MELDRQTIEKRDFPVGRRGYEPEAVDAHLTALADEVDTLRRQLRQRGTGGDSLAVAASSHVQAIVQAAEATAAEIEQEADAEAKRIRSEAEHTAERTRDDAVARAQAHVEAVGKATEAMLQRVDAMESELSALVETLRTGAGRLTADLSMLQTNMGDLYGVSGRRSGSNAASSGGGIPDELPAASDDDIEEGATRVPAASSPSSSSPAGASAPSASAGAVTTPSTPAPSVGRPAPTPPAPPAAAGDSADVDGARLVALNMALNGQPREEADKYLAENYELPDREGLLDEVYAAIDG